MYHFVFFTCIIECRCLYETACNIFILKWRGNTQMIFDIILQELFKLLQSFQNPCHESLEGNISIF